MTCGKKADPSKGNSQLYGEIVTAPFTGTSGTLAEFNLTNRQHALCHLDATYAVDFYALCFSWKLFLLLSIVLEQELPTVCVLCSMCVSTAKEVDPTEKDKSATAVSYVWNPHKKRPRIGHRTW